VFVFPTTLGIEHRIVNGRVYITAIPVLDSAEIGRRAAIFGERAGYYYENWDALYEGWKTRMRELIRQIESVTVPELPEFEDAAVVMESIGIAQNHYLRANFHRCIDLFSVIMLSALADRGEGGKRWLAAFEEAREPWFNVSTGDGFYHHHRSWADDLTVPFTALPRYVAQVRDGLLADRPTEALRAERERIAASSAR
jgi:hypothetical protein